MIQFQPNISISSTKNTDFSIKENNRKKITEDDVKKVLDISSSSWKNPISIIIFGVFESAVLSKNIKLFVAKLNEISSKAPTFDLISFLETEIKKLSNTNFKSYNDYYKQFSKDLDSEFQKVKSDLDNKIITVLTNKVSPIFANFNIANPGQTNSYKKLISDIVDHKNSIDPKWNFIQDNLKKIIDNLEKNKNSSYQIDGLTGFYNKVDWNNEFKAFFDTLGQYDTKEAKDGFAKVVIESIVDDYKEQLKKLITKNQQTYEYRNLVEILHKNSGNLDFLGKIDALFPGAKAIIEKIQIHSNKKSYGGFGISYTSLSENMKFINILFTWKYNNENYLLINNNNPVQNSKSDVQIAIRVIALLWYQDSMSWNKPFL